MRPNKKLKYKKDFSWAIAVPIQSHLRSWNPYFTQNSEILTLVFSISSFRPNATSWAEISAHLLKTQPSLERVAVAVCFGSVTK